MINRTYKLCSLTRNLWKEKPFFSAVIVFLSIFFLYSIIYIPSSGISATDDHFFYFRYASLIKEKGFNVVNNFPWIHFSRTVTENARYNVSLFNLALIPFTFFKDPIFGLKISDIFWASLAYSSLYYLLRKMEIKYSSFYILILISFGYISVRFIYGRAYVITSSLVFFEVFLAAKKKYKLLFLLSIFHVFWHQATYPFPLLIVFLVEASRYIVERKFLLKNIFSSTLGIIVGMAFLPGFPGNINIFGWFRYLFNLSSKISNEIGFRKIEGLELSSKNIFNFWSHWDESFLLLIIGLSLFAYYYLKDKKIFPGEREQQNHVLVNWRLYAYPIFLLTILSFCFSILISGRFLDYYFVGTIFLFALMINRFISEEGLVLNSHIKKSFYIGFLIFFSVAFLNSIISLQESFNKKNYEGIGKSAEWIDKKSSSGEIIFLYDWDNFPVAFFHNQKNTYTMGLEPESLAYYDKNLYWKWYNIFLYQYFCDIPEDCSREKGNIIKEIDDNKEKMNEFNKNNSEKIISAIKNDFKSRFIISDSYLFDNVLKQNPDLIKDSFTYVIQPNQATVSAFELK